MIDIRVDEAYAFDYLSILQIKNNKDNFNNCRDYITDQVGKNNYDEIVRSDEYQSLVDANQEVFDLVEKIRKGETVTGLELDNANMARYYTKQALQKKFFNNELTETKTK